MDIVNTLLESTSRLPDVNGSRTLDVRIGPFWTAVNTTRGAGLASTMACEARPHVGLPVPSAGGLLKKPPLDMVEMLRSSSPTEAAIGLASINALIARPEGKLSGDKALALLKTRCRNRRVAMVGRFPFAEELRPLCGELSVFEQNHRLGPTVVSTDEIPALMPQAKVVAITATTLINKTIRGIMEHVSSDAWVMMLGPSTPMAPCLFDFGFDVLCGTLVTAPETVLNEVSQGATTKQITGVERLTLWRDG